MENLRRLGGIAGILSGAATVWLAIGLTVAFPAAGLSVKGEQDPARYLPFITRHAALFWTVGTLGGVLAALAAGILVLALADRFHEDSRDQARLGLALGLVGAVGLAIGAFLRLTGFGYLAAVYGSTRQGAAVAFYAVNGVAASCLALADLALGLGALTFGGMMLRTPAFTQAGYMSIVAGTPLIISAFMATDVLGLIASGLTALWLTWSGWLLWAETMPAERVRGARSSRPGVFRHAV
ncbi:MAG: hypothetical protein ACYDAB_04300 [bacterium]